MEPKEIKPDITAQWARTHVNTVMSEKLKEQLKNILVSIEDAVKQNRFYINPSSVDDLVKEELTKRGFSVEYHPITSNDPRETSYYTIKW